MLSSMHLGQKVCIKSRRQPQVETCTERHVQHLHLKCCWPLILNHASPNTTVTTLNFTLNWMQIGALQSQLYTCRIRPISDVTVDYRRLLPIVAFMHSHAGIFKDSSE